jgi:hypothetical protein
MQEHHELHRRGGEAKSQLAMVSRLEEQPRAARGEEGLEHGIVQSLDLSFATLFLPSLLNLLPWFLPPLYLSPPRQNLFPTLGAWTAPGVTYGLRCWTYWNGSFGLGSVRVAPASANGVAFLGNQQVRELAGEGGRAFGGCPESRHLLSSPLLGVRAAQHPTRTLPPLVAHLPPHRSISPSLPPARLRLTSPFFRLPHSRSSERACRSCRPARPRSSAPSTSS